MGCRLFFCQQRQVSSHFSLFMIPIIFKDSSIQSVDNFGGSDSNEPSDDSSSDSDAEASDLHAPEALLHFPSPDEQGDSAESKTYCDLPSTVQDLQHDLLRKHELPNSPPSTASRPRPLTDS